MLVLFNKASAGDTQFVFNRNCKEKHFLRKLTWN